MTSEPSLLLVLGLAAAVFAVAALYSSVGHGGASGYLAVLSLFAWGGPKEMATTALVLNILVAGIACRNYMKAGHMSTSLTWPFIVLSVPAAFLGGMLPVSRHLYFLLLAGVLLFTAVRLIVPTSFKSRKHNFRTPSLTTTIPAGAGIGLLSGIVGIGGGIFLSPLALLMRWANAKRISATAACFIVVNSIAGLVGRMVSGRLSFGPFLPMVVAAMIGGIIGSYCGANRFTSCGLKRILALVLLVAAVKLIMTAFSQ